LGSLSEGILLEGIDVQALAVDGFHIWIGTLDSGIRRYNKRHDTWNLAAPEELSSDSVLAISVDAESVWLGTARSGVYRYDKFDGSWKNYTMSHGLPGDNITAIASTPGSGVWCGTWQKGVSFFDNLSGGWQSDPGMIVGDSITVTSIAAGANYVWFAWYGKSYEKFSNGVSRYDMSTKSRDSFPNTEDIEAVGTINLAASDTEAWVGTNTEALLYDYASLQWYPPFDYPPEISGSATACVLISDDSVWFGTERGLGRLDKKLLKRIEYVREKIIGKDDETF
jgi:ligand-binding sensor domain-containing protein